MIRLVAALTALLLAPALFAQAITARTTWAVESVLDSGPARQGGAVRTATTPAAIRKEGTAACHDYDAETAERCVKLVAAASFTSLTNYTSSELIIPLDKPDAFGRHSYLRFVAVRP